MAPRAVVHAPDDQLEVWPDWVCRASYEDRRLVDGRVGDQVTGGQLVYSAHAWSSRLCSQRPHSLAGPLQVDESEQLLPLLPPRPGLVLPAVADVPALAAVVVDVAQRHAQVALQVDRFHRPDRLPTRVIA